MKNPIVLEPANFNQKDAWIECAEYVAKCGGMQHVDGEPNMRAAAGADPGICSCPQCEEMYWCWGRVQRCTVCKFTYPTDWWPMYSYGVMAGKSEGCRFKHDDRMKHAYYRYGFEHPVPDAYIARELIAWEDVIGEWAALTPDPVGE